MEFLNPYSIPAIVALGLKLLLLLVVRIMPLRNTESRVFLAFLAVLALHNFSEIMVFNYSGPKEGVIPLRSGLLYFAMSVVAMAVLVHLMLIRLKSSTGWDLSLEHWKLLYLPAAGVLYLMWTSDDMIRGFVAYGFSYTRVPGPLYVWFELYALTYLSASIVILGVATAFSVNRSQKRKNIITSLGMAPIITMPIVVIVLQKTGINVFNLPLWFALALTFFLMIMAYAIYEHRLFDVFFYLPGTPLHSRRTRFHQDIRAFLSELDRLPDMSISDALHRLATTLKCSVVLVGSGRAPVAAQPVSGDATPLRFEQLADDDLDKIDGILLTKEVRGDRPEIYASLSAANCAAVLPFRPFKDASAGWLLLGGGKNAPDDLPIDFALVESLFNRMGDLFLDNIVRERAEMEQLQQELRRRMVENEQLREQVARKESAMNKLYETWSATGAGAGGGSASLEELTTGLEKKVICETLAQLQGNVSATAKTLGLTRQTLYTKMENYGIDRAKWRRRRKGA